MTTDDDSAGPAAGPEDSGDLERRLLRLESELDRLKSRQAQAGAEIDYASAKRQDIREATIARLANGILALLFGALLLAAQSLYWRYDLEWLRIRATETPAGPTAAPPAPAAPPAAAAAPTTPRDVIERYIERQAQPTAGGGAQLSLSVNGVVDLVKSLGKAGVIGAEAAKDLTTELTKQGADVASHTAKALVDKYLGPAPAADKPSAREGGGPTQQVLVNVYPATPGQRTTPPPRPARPAPRCAPAA